MDATTHKINTQPPFETGATLMIPLFFANYCRQNRIYTNLFELEKYSREELLVPFFHKHSKNHAQLLGETSYSPYQMYPLRFIQNMQKEANLSITEQTEVNQFGKRSNSKEKLKYKIQERVLEYYQFFKLYLRIQQFWQKRQGKIAAHRNYLLSDWEYKTDDPQLEKDMQAKILTIDQELNNSAPKIMRKHGFTLKQLELWQLFLLSYGALAGSMGRADERWDKYNSKFTNEQIIAADETYQIISLLNWFITRCGGQETTIHQMLFGDSEYRNCSYCLTNFKTKKQNQVTCGNNACVKLNSNASKREKRKKKNGLV